MFLIYYNEYDGQNVTKTNVCITNTKDRAETIISEIKHDMEEIDKFPHDFYLQDYSIIGETLNKIDRHNVRFIILSTDDAQNLTYEELKFIE